MRTLLLVALLAFGCAADGVETEGSSEVPEDPGTGGVPGDIPEFPEDPPSDPPEVLGGAAGAGGAEMGGSAGASDVPPGAAGASSGGTGGPDPAGSCPTNGPPPGPFDLRFDIATLQCGGGVCTGAEDKCLCQPDFEALAALPGHFLAVSSDFNKAVTWGSGNVQAVYVDDLNTDWKLGGKARADTLIAKMKNKFPCGVPKWFLMNEISHSLWPDTPAYRQFLIDFAKTMKSVYGKTVVIAAPWQKVAANGASWSELQKYAFIGVEAYLSGKEIKDAGFSVAWCQAQYAESVASYVKQGVPKSRQILFEHFGNTTTMLDSGIPVKWGRQAVSAADWHKAIKVRSAAAKNIGYAGFVSYDWGANRLHAPQADRLAFMKTYRSQILP
jgi:hypothetical protein